MSRYRIACCIALALGIVGPVAAAAADDVRARIDAYRELGASFKAVRDGTRGSETETVLVQQAARQIRNAALAQYTLFPAGSGPESGPKTAAKAEIWTRPAEFKAAQDAFAKVADSFQRTAAKGDAAAIRAEAQKLGATCKACHDKFRVERD